MENAKKRGRKEKPYRTAAGEYVNGLRRRKNDGRWVVVATGKMFTEPDEKKAIAFFRRLTEASKYDGVSPETAVFHRAAIAGAVVAKNSVSDIGNGFTLIGDPVEAEKRFWAYVGSQIRARPKWVAEQTDIEEIGYLTHLKKPEPLPTLQALRDNWTKHARGTSENNSKIARYWDKFVEVTGIKGIDDITPQLCITYQDYIYNEDYAPKMQSHLFSGVRTLLNFAKKRAIAIVAISRALEYCQMMHPNGSTVNRDSKPITREDFHKLLAKTTGTNKAMLLMMLNAALYLGEVVTVQWSELKYDGTYISHRKKTGEFIRVATLWPETIVALKAVERKGEFVFLSTHGTPLNKFTAFERFRVIRDAAGCPEVQASHFRDGAYTAAIQANVTLPLVNTLVGHSNKMGDAYFGAKPQAVKPACDAIHDHYFG